MLSPTFGLLLFLRGVDSTDAVKIVMLVVAQTFLGTTCWIILKQAPLVSKVENHAIGYGIGFAIFIIAVQFLISIGILIQGNFILETISFFS